MKQTLPKRKEGESSLDYLNRVKAYWEEQKKWDKVEEVAEKIVAETRGKAKKSPKKAPKREEEFPELQRPVRTEGESLTDYMKRLKEWKEKIKRKGLKSIGDHFDL